MRAGMNGRRIYTYTDDEGNTYWSFTRRLQTVSPPVRLILHDRVGTHVINFLAELRRAAEALWSEKG
jgi:hypothetical protein